MVFGLNNHLNYIGNVSHLKKVHSRSTITLKHLIKKAVQLETKSTNNDLDAALIVYCII